jgi:hypothetical protein
LSDFDFLLEDKEEPKRRRRPQCRYCKYFNKIPDHQLKTSPSPWSDKGECWYRKEVLKKDFVVCKYWKPKWDCQFEWRDIFKEKCEYGDSATKKDSI